MNPSVKTPPSNLPVTLDAMKLHLRIVSSDQDSLIADMLKSATERVEIYTRRALLTQTFKYYLEDWPENDAIVLLRPPLQTVTSVEYYDITNTKLTFSDTLYYVDTISQPGRVVIKKYNNWPTEELREYWPILCTYVAGYGDSENVPEEILLGIKMIVAHWFENRETYMIGVTSSRLPLGAKEILFNYRMLTI